MRENQESQSINNRAFVERQRLVGAHAPDMWSDVAKAFQKHCEVYNKVEPQPALVFSALNSNCFLLRHDGGMAELTLEYKPNTRTIRVRADNCHLDEIYRVAVDRDQDSVVLVRQSQGQPVHPLKIAQHAIGEFLRGRAFPVSL
jgi:hypothetical protein